MKDLSLIFLIIILLFSCSKERDDLIFERELRENLVGTWVDEDSYIEYKYEDELWSVEDHEGIIYKINENGSYLVENELEFGIPSGSGSWIYHGDYKTIEFLPAKSTNYDTTINFYWNHFEFDEAKMKVNFYRTTETPTTSGTIKSNRIPRHFIK